MKSFLNEDKIFFNNFERFRLELTEMGLVFLTETLYFIFEHYLIFGQEPIS